MLHTCKYFRSCPVECSSPSQERGALTAVFTDGQLKALRYKVTYPRSHSWSAVAAKTQTQICGLPTCPCVQDAPSWGRKVWGWQTP